MLPLASDLWKVSGDATQLHQVLMNLLVNARDVMPDGGTLSICAKNFFIDKYYARMNLDASVGPYIDQVALAAGVNVKAFLSKPYTLKELLNTINSVLTAR